MHNATFVKVTKNNRNILKIIFGRISSKSVLSKRKEKYGSLYANIHANIHNLNLKANIHPNIHKVHAILCIANTSWFCFILLVMEFELFLLSIILRIFKTHFSRL